MKKQLSIISLFVLLNMGVGRLFQESLSVVCFTELLIIAITGFLFWTATAKLIQKGAFKWNMLKSKKDFMVQGGLGLSTVALHILISQAMVIFLMTILFSCTSSSFDLLNLTLTNNVAVNLLCYFSLLLYFLYSKREMTADQSDLAISATNGNSKISVSKSGFKFLLSPEELIYVETANNCIVLHTELGKYVKYQSLKSFQAELPEHMFKRIHRSYLVNTDYIQCVQKNKSGDGLLKLMTGEKIRFSRTYQKEIPQL